MQIQNRRDKLHADIKWNIRWHFQYYLHTYIVHGKSLTNFVYIWTSNSITCIAILKKHIWFFFPKFLTNFAQPAYFGKIRVSQKFTGFCTDILGFNNLIMLGFWHFFYEPKLHSSRSYFILIFPKFQTIFARPTPAVLDPVVNVNAKNAEGAPAEAGQDLLLSDLSQLRQGLNF